MYQARIMTAATLAAAVASCAVSNQSPAKRDDAGDALGGAGGDADSVPPDGGDADSVPQDGAAALESGRADGALQTGGDGGSARDASAGADTGSQAGLHHTMIILMENHGYGDIIGDTTDAPYINGLATGYASATAWTDVSHPSLPNYLALTAGSFFSSPQDCIPTWATSTGDCTFDTPANNLADQLTAAGIPWRAYMEDMPSACDTTDSFTPGSYDVNHNPFVYFDHVVQTASECSNVVPYEQLATDLAAGTMPAFLWVTPNIIHDMHNGTIADGDAFLHGLIPQIQSSAWYQQGGSIILTWDEGETTDQIVAIVVSIANTGRGAFGTPGNHFGTLRGIEEVYGLPLLGSASDPASGDLKPILQ